MDRGDQPRTSEQTRRLTQQIWSFCDILRDDGITYQDYIAELSWLLFIYLSSDDARISVHPRTLPQGLRWQDITSTQPDGQLEFWRWLLSRLDRSSDELTSSIFADARTAITNPSAFARLIASIDKLQLTALGDHPLGEIYEGLLERNATEQRSGAGQYFTPRFLVDLIVRLVNPHPGETIQDPAAGTGGFLVAAARHIQASTTLSDDSTTYFGVELVRSAHRLCLMNLFLHGVPATLVLGDTLTDVGSRLPAADVILSNPPFGTKRGAGLVSRPDLTFETSNKQLAFVQHIYRSLRPGGRAGIIVPDNVLFDNGVGRHIRAEMYDVCQIDSILRLPPGIFYAQGVKTNVLFLTRIDRHDSSERTGTWIFDARTNVSASRSSRATLTSALSQFEEFYKQDFDGRCKFSDGDDARARFFAKSAIRDRDFNLDIETAIKTDSASADTDPLALIAQIQAELHKLMTQTDSLRKTIFEKLAK